MNTAKMTMSHTHTPDSDCSSFHNTWICLNSLYEKVIVNAVCDFSK